MICAWNGPASSLQIASPTPENERVGFVAWQWLQHFHREGLSADVRLHWSLLASLLPRGTVNRDARLEIADLVVKC